jgi:general transcription factor 3C polypeptide 1
LKLELHQRFEIQNGSTSKIDHDVSTTVTGEEANQACNVKDTLINDDLPSLKEICRKIEDAENKVLIISDLKVNLGYRFTHGHRAWRRVNIFAF